MSKHSFRPTVLCVFGLLLLATSSVSAVEKFRVSEFGGGTQLWFEVEDFDERDPDDESSFALSDEPGAFGRSISSINGNDGASMIRYTFDIRKAGGVGGTWFFWGRVKNPNNNSDFMLVDGHPGDQVPFTLPVSGLVNGQRIFEQSGRGPDWHWAPAASAGEESHTKQLRDGENTMYVLNRESGAIWDVFMWTDDPGYVPTDDDYLIATIPSAGTAGSPSPGGGAADVPWYIDELTWAAGDFARTHNVYFGTSFADVNDRAASALVGEGLTDTSQAMQTELETTYYWAVDEVNGAPDFTVHAGDVWDFTVESLANPITNVTATADGQFNADTGPENTVNGSGLTDGLHGTNAGDMWQTGPLPATIEFVFDQVYVLHEMEVWNQNQLIESFLGFGAKDVIVEVSANGTDFIAVDGVGPLNQAPGAAGYAANTTIALNGVQAMSLRMTLTSAYGVVGQVGLSEVQFTAIPAFPREFSPADGEETDDLDVTLSWRAGRFAAEHRVLLSQDQAAVADGSAVIATTPEKSHALSGLNYGSAYYTQIIDLAADGTTYPGPINLFFTPASQAIDDMESYRDEEFLEIWATWVDGFDDPANNGSLVGGIAGIPETGQVYEGGQSLPMEYDLTSASVAEATRTFDPSLDLTAGAPDVLGIFFQGDPNNGAASFYLTVTDSAGQSVKVSHPDPSATNLTAWTLLNIPFTDMGNLNLSGIRSITIGVEDSGATGTVFVDYLHVSIASPSPEAVLRGLSDVGASSDDVVAWFEAESGEPTAPMEILDDPTASGGQYVAVPNGSGSSTDQPPADGLATYSLTIPEDGVYRLAFRVIAPSGSDDSFWVRILGMVTNTANHASGWVRFNSIQGGNTWHWDEVHSNDDGDTVVEFTLSAGTQTLEVRYREDGTLLDAIAVLK